MPLLKGMEPTGKEDQTTEDPMRPFLVAEAGSNKVSRECNRGLNRADSKVDVDEDEADPEVGEAVRLGEHHAVLRRQLRNHAHGGRRHGE